MQCDNDSRYIKAEHIVEGRWARVFEYAGLGEYLEFVRKEGPCPICGGKTRFRFLDLHTSGKHFCNTCPDLPKGVGYGFRLLQEFNSWTFAQAAQCVKEALGVSKEVMVNVPIKLPPKVVPKPAQSDDELRAKYEKLWNSGFELARDNAAGKYVLNRAPGIGRFPSVLRFHPALDYFEDVPKDQRKPNGPHYRKVGVFPGMLAYLVSSTGELATVWRWYLTDDGQKADVEGQKKAAGRILTTDLALRLSEPTDGILATCEGAENGLAIWAMHGIAVWPAMDAGYLEKFKAPQGLKRLYVYGDNDEAKAATKDNPNGIRRGNVAAKKLIEATKEAGMPAFLRMPSGTKFDFADIHKRRNQSYP